MRGVWTVPVVAALGILTWLAFRSPSGEQPPPARAPGEDPQAWNPASPISGDRRPVPSKPPDTPSVPAPRVTPDPLPPQPPPLPEGVGRIQLLVFDSTTNQPVQAFSCVFTQGDRRQKLEVTEGGQGSLEVPLDERGDLLVEAEGYTPHSRRGYSVEAAAREVQLTIYLDPVAPFSGIEIRALDDRGMPVRHLRVTARQSDDHRVPSLWVRQASDERGIYQLPDLPPAIYRLSLAAIDADGQPLTLLPHTETVIFQGHEQIPVTVQFRPGALLTIAVKDAAGAQLRGTEVSLRMIFPDGKPLSVGWRSTVDGEVLERRDGLPAAAPATSEPLPPGSYELVLQLPTGLEQRLAVQLLAGQHQQLELRL